MNRLLCDVRTSEVAKLIEYMFHRRMSGRPNRGQPQNVLSERIRRSRRDPQPFKDLNQLGPRVVPLMVDEYHTRIRATPLWKDELRQWIRDLLLNVDWKEAKEAAGSLTDSQQDVGLASIESDET